jgi:hypothetical protein
MSKIDELKADIERLPSEEMAELFRWLSEKEWESWNREVEADSQKKVPDTVSLTPFPPREGERSKGELP